jgi:predicted metal-dependent enzyme (double-stranded beta helix superfamily)
MTIHSVFKKLVTTIKKESVLDEKIAMQLFVPFIKEIAASAAWLEKKYFQVPESCSGFHDHLIYEGDNHTMAILVTTWLPGHGYPPHNHETWSISASVVGSEVHTLWQAINPTTICPIKTIVCEPGEVITLPHEAIHSVVNDSEDLAISLQMYGQHPKYTQRRHFKIT